ncbi:MAG: PIN domain-containing protein [Bacteroidetes bacterium]|nr:PIN domain-containing protein [Candidatus Colenecus caballi]
MKVFLDTNIFLDTIVRRDKREDNENAFRLLKIAALDGFEFYISPITVSNSFYILRKETDVAATIGNRLGNIHILPMDDKDVRYALSGHITDMEDAMQVSCADRGGCDIILTRDSRHFADSPVPAFSPAEFLARLNV